MPVLKPLADVARADGKFLVDALAGAGVANVAVTQRDPAWRHEIDDDEIDDEAVRIEGALHDIEALLAGKQKTELSALEKLKAEKRAATTGASGSLTAPLSIRGTVAALRALVVTLAPQRESKTGGARDVASEAGAIPSARKRDRVRRADGRYIKGLRPGGAQKAGPAPAASASAKTSASTTGEMKAAALDRTQFALANLAAFIAAGLERAAAAAAADGDGAGDDDVIVIFPGGEVRRE